MSSANGSEEDHLYYVVGGTEEKYLPWAGVQIWAARQAITKYIGQIYPNDKVVWVSVDQVRNVILQGVSAIRNKLGYLPVVSLSSLYSPLAGGIIDCNRIVSTTGESLGLGNRAGSQPLAEQVSTFVSQYRRDCIVTDDTLFHGETLSCIRKAGLRVRGLVVAFATHEAVEQAAKDGIEVHVGQTLGPQVRDIMPIHDFLPPMPLCGKAIGSNNLSPLTSEGLSFSLPYVLPWISAEQLEAWASIPVTHAVPFSHMCLENSLEIFVQLQKAGITTIGDLRRIRPRASRPFDGQTMPSQKITHMLAQAIRKVETSKALIS